MSFFIKNYLIVLYSIYIFIIFSYIIKDSIYPFIDWKSKFPSLNNLLVNKNYILIDLYNILNESIWCEYGDGNYYNQPEFSNFSEKELLSYLRNNYGTIDSNNKWRLFGLITNGKRIPESASKCKKTVDMLLKIPNLKNAGFSLLESNSKTDIHRGFDSSFYRFHLPLLIPNNKCYFWSMGFYKYWNEPLMFKDTLYHGSWNNSNSHRYILIIDLYK